MISCTLMLQNVSLLKWSTGHIYVKATWKYVTNGFSLIKLKEEIYIADI